MCQKACVGLGTMSLEEGPKLTKQQKAIRTSLYRVQNLDIYRSTNTALDTECQFRVPLYQFGTDEGAPVNVQCLSEPTFLEL